MSEKENNKIESTDLVQSSSNELLGDIDFQKFLIVLRKSLIWIVLILLIAFVSSYLYLRYTVPVYESSSVLKLEIKSDVDALGIPAFQKQVISNNLSGEVELIKSELIHEQVINNIPELEISYMTEGRLKDEERFKNSFFELKYKYVHPDLMNKKIQLKIIDNNSVSIIYSLGGQRFEETVVFNKPFKNKHLNILLKKTTLKIADIEQEQFYIIINSRDALLNMIKTNLFVQVLNPSANTLKILYRDPNPLKAKTIVDNINKVYLENTLELKNQASKQTIGFLNEQLRKTEEKLSESENQLEEFVAENKTTNIDNIFSRKLEQIEKLRVEIRLNEERLIQLKNLKDAFESGDTLVYHQLSSSNQGFSNYQSKMDELIKDKRELEILRYSTQPNTLAYQYAKKDIESREKALFNTLEKDLQNLREEIREMRTERAQIESELKDLPEKETEYKRLKRVYDLNEKFYLLLMDKKAEFGIGEAGTIPDFQVLSPANLPSEPVYPKDLEVYLLSFGAALVLIFILVGVRFISHNTIDTVEEIEKYLNIPMLGVVPFQKTRGKYSKLFVSENPKSEIAEALRSIRTNLDFLAPESEKNKILSVTSTVGSEGKTYVSVNLGSVIAMSNQKVLLMDLDMRKPKLHIAVNEDNKFGMSNVLIDRMEAKDAIRQTTQENLDFISSGPPPPNPSELILLDKLDHVLAELREIYDIIIIDSPPIGLVTDGIIIMKKADIPIYVLRSEFSKKIFLKSIQKLQNQKGISHLSLIFNGLKKRRGVGGYGYSYGYSGDYYGEEKKDKKLFGIF